MKIAWFTPFSKESAIGYYSKLATEAIKEDYEIIIWVSVRDGENLLDSPMNIIRYDVNENLEELTKYDLIIYNFGNCYEYHIDIYKVSQLYNGILILHDVVMHNFFMGVWLLDENNQNGYIDYLGERYGDAVKKMAISSFCGQIVPPFWETDKCAEYPFIEKTIQNAKGIIVHSKYHYNIINHYFGGIMAEIEFPFLHKRGIQSFNKNRDTKRIKLLTYGQVNRNKCIDQVIKAIGTSEILINKIEYDIIGSLRNTNYVEDLRKLISYYGLEQQVNLLGYKNDNELDKYIENADVMINLRSPAFEGASWSLLEQMSKEKLIVVTDTGCYSEIPDDCIIKIKQGYEVEQIQKLLLNVDSNYDMVKSYGQNAKRIAVNKYNIENYKCKFNQFVQCFKEEQPLEMVIAKVIEELCNFGIHTDMDIIDTVVDKLGEIVC